MFNPFLDDGEGNSFDGSIMYPDFNAGMTFSSMPSSKFAYYVGFALNHIAEPTETFLGNNFNKIGSYNFFEDIPILFVAGGPSFEENLS